MDKLTKQASTFTKKMIHTYFVKRNFEEIFQNLDENITWIGTGEQEICKNIEDALYLCSLDAQKHNMNFEIQREWYYPIAISPTIFVVFGEVVFKSNIHTQSLIEVPTRFTLVCKLHNGKMKLCHVHNSVAYSAQEKDEFFPENIGKHSYTLLQKILKQKTIEIENITNSLDGGVATISCNRFLSVSYANDEFYKLIGYTREEFSYIMQNHATGLIYKDDIRILHEQLLCDHNVRKKIRIEFRICKKNGEIIWLLLTGHRIDDEKDIPTFLCILVDITETKKIQHKLEIEKKRYKIIAEQSDNILFEYDIQTYTMIYSNKYTHYTEKNLHVSNYIYTTLKGNFIYEEDIPKFLKLMQEISSGKNFITTDIRINVTDDSFKWFKIRATILFDDNLPIKAIGSIINIDAEKREHEILKLKAQLDPLTKLYNKMVSKSLIEKHLNIEAKDDRHAIMILDIDNFKAVNDNLGHIFGDSVLSEVSYKIKKTFKKSDIIGRIGGDEFIILLKNIDSYNLIYEKANLLSNAFKNTYTGENNDYKISASIGIAIYPTHGTTYDILFKKADNALYNAKNKGKNRFEIFDPNLTINDKNELYLLNEYTETENSNRFTHSFENDLATYAFDIMSETKDVNSAINLILAKIGEHFKLSRTSILETYHKDSLLGLTYEWCNKNIKSIKSELQNLKFNKWDNYLSNFYKEGFINYSVFSKSSLPSDLKYIYDYIENKSILHCPILDNGKFKGCVCFDIFCEDHVWTKAEIETFTSITKIIGSYLLKMRTKKLLEEEKLMTQAVAKNQNLYTYMLKPNSYELIYLSPNTEELYPNAKIGECCYKSLKDKDAPCAYCPLYGLSSNYSQSNTIEFYDEYLNGWISSTASKINLSKDKKANLICFSNVTNFIDRITSKDSLTGVLTLNKFEVVAKDLISKCSNERFALLYCDIDRFKYVNETSGYAVGNKVLISFANLASSYLYKGELICRSSADNFIVLLKYKNMDILKERLSHFSKKFMEVQKIYYNNVKIPITAGLYLIQPTDNDLSMMIDKANIARRTIKGSHKSRFALYDYNLHLKITKEKEIENIMFSSLENKEFLIYLQPKIELPSQKIVGAEALVRWLSPNKKLIPPIDFIPLFEKNGFIIDLDFYVYEEVFKKMRSWIDEKKELIPISVNVSRAHINDIAFIPRLKELTKKYSIPTNLIELELTESIFFENVKPLLETMKKLKELGFTCSIDDFGSGYSSLNLLKDLPIDVLKLDKEFFPNNYINNKEKVIISNIVKMAQELNITVLSEGIETQEQAEFLTKIGCNMAQGYLFDKPMPIDIFEQKIWG